MKKRLRQVVEIECPLCGQYIGKILDGAEFKCPACKAALKFPSVSQRDCMCPTHDIYTYNEAEKQWIPHLLPPKISEYNPKRGMVDDSIVVEYY